MQSPLAAASLLLATTFLPAQSPALPEPPAPVGKEELRARRAALMNAIFAAIPDRDVVVLVRGATKQPDMGAFVQDQDFLYLTGVAEPDLAVLMAGGPGKSGPGSAGGGSAAGEVRHDELLVPPFSRFAATWDGDFLAPGEKTAERTGFATCGNVKSLHSRLDALLAPDGGKPPVLLTLSMAAARTGSTPRKARDTAKAIAEDPFDGRPSREDAFLEALRRKYGGLDVQPLERFLHPLRHKKSDGEVRLVRAATEIAAAGIAEAMRSARPGVYEFQLAAAARFVFSLHGAGPDAYSAIVGGGPNGCILHYNACTRQLRDDDLIVMDYAPTVHGYASDVTRTFPASGKFTPEQRKLVQDVYEIQQALIADVKPGASLHAIDRKCSKMLVERGYVRDHGPCHHVGLAVHDPEVDVLAPGMIITVEPGAYLRDRGMGCRIEDTILVTADGNEVLSKGVPSTPDEIEKLMQESGLLDRAGARAR